ncbi:MAG: GNAT family N-acetyltransferase [Planctomycetaceae bacterium]
MTKFPSSVGLLETATGKIQSAILHQGIHERHIVDVEQLWQPACGLLDRWSAGKHVEESSHWDWRKKVRSVRRNSRQDSFAIEFGELTQGLMIVTSGKRSRIEVGEKRELIYVDYVEVAPWNRNGWKPQRLFASIGSVFVRVAIDFSFDRGFEGRIGLHSLPQADGFYRRMGLLDLGPDTDYDDLRYFEMTSTRAHQSS